MRLFGGKLLYYSFDVVAICNAIEFLYSKYYISSETYPDGIFDTVADFTKMISLCLAKPPLKANGCLAKPGLTSLVE